MRAIPRREEFVTPDCDLTNKLAAHVDSFIKVFEGNRVKMEQTVHRCRRMHSELTEIQDRLLLSKIMGVMSVIIGLLLFIFLSGTVYKIFIILSVFVLVCLCVSETSTVQTKEKQCVETVGRLLRNFREPVQLLKTKLEKVKRLCEDVCRESCGFERTNLMKAEVRILELFLLTDSLRETVAAESVKEVSDRSDCA